jgi:hypothetical protein
MTSNNKDAVVKPDLGAFDPSLDPYPQGNAPIGGGRNDPVTNPGPGRFNPNRPIPADAPRTEGHDEE